MKNVYKTIKRQFHRNVFRLANKSLHGENGFTLVEVLVAVAIVGIASTILIGGMITSSKILQSANADETARDYAQSQMENIQNQKFMAIPAYTPLPASERGGYTISSTAVNVKTGLQLITVTVSDGSTSFVLSGYKVDY